MILMVPILVLVGSPFRLRPSSALPRAHRAVPKASFLASSKSWVRCASRGFQFLQNAHKWCL